MLTSSPADASPETLKPIIKAGDQSPEDDRHAGRRQWCLIVRKLSQVCFGLLIITLPWRWRLTLSSRPVPPVYADFTDLNLYAHDLMLIILLALWGTSHLLKRRRLRFGPLFICYPLVGLLAAAALSVVRSSDRLLSSFALVHLLLAGLLYLFVINEVTEFRAQVWAFATLLILQGIVAVGQGWLQHDLGWFPLGELDLDPFKNSAFVWAEGGRRALSVYGLADHANILAINVVLAGGMLITSYFSSTGKRRILLIASICLAAATLFLTFSRTAWTAMAAGGAVFTALFIQTRRPVRIRSWLALTIAAAVITLPLTLQFLPFLSIGTDGMTFAARVQERLQATDERRILNVTANNLFSSNAVAGVGLGALPLAMVRSFNEFPYDYRPAPVTVLDVAAEIGLFGALFYTMLMFAPWVVLFIWRDRIQFSVTLIGLSSVLLALSVFNFLDAYGWSYRSGLIWQWLLWGMWATQFSAARASAATLHRPEDNLSSIKDPECKIFF